MTIRKARYKRAVRTTITLPPALFEASREVIHKRGFVGLSDYVQARLRADAGLDLAAA
jgi:hypothetical protein